MIWIERYPERYHGVPSETYDLVSFVRNEMGGLHTPNWKRITREDVHALRERITQSCHSTTMSIGDAIDRLYVQFDNRPELLAILGQVFRECYPAVLPVPELDLRDGHPPLCLRHGVVSFLWTLPNYFINLEVALSDLNWLAGTWFCLNKRNGLSVSRDVQLGRHGDRRDWSWILDGISIMLDEK